MVGNSIWKMRWPACLTLALVVNPSFADQLPPGWTLAPSNQANPHPPLSNGHIVIGINYPTKALRAGMQGIVEYELSIDSEGQITNCRITASSGYDALDNATCGNINMAARLHPATDAGGKSIPGIYRDHLRYVIPGWPTGNEVRGRVPAR